MIIIITMTSSIRSEFTAQDFVSTTAVCSAAIISGCSQGTAVDAYGVRQVQAAVITDWNCDNVASGCTCHTNNANGRGCNSTDVGY